RRRGAALAVHPAGVAVDVMLLLPDRQPVLHFVDDVAAGAKGLVAMRCDDAHPHREFTDAEVAEPVHAGDARDAELRARLGEDALALDAPERLEGLVFEMLDALAVVQVPHPAFEGGVAAGGGIRERRACAR